MRSFSSGTCALVFSIACDLCLIVFAGPKSRLESSIIFDGMKVRKDLHCGSVCRRPLRFPWSSAHSAAESFR